MSSLAIAALAFVAYILAYKTYGRWLARKIFRLDPDKIPPSVECEDGNDYIATSKYVVFGHHFTSIAGAGPIVGPALAVIWGWLPALIWVLVGSIFIGAVHDFGSLVVSLRHKGRSVGDIAGSVISQRARVLFLSILFMALALVLAVFGIVIANVFRLYPNAIFPCVIQVPLAILIGFWIKKYADNTHLLIGSIIALALMYLSIYLSDAPFIQSFNASLAGMQNFTWVTILLVYSFFASILPVWLLLQPRDFINSLQLISALALILIGLVVASFFGGAPVGEAGVRPALELVAPVFRSSADSGSPPIFPFLFITVACGAISGFHCLVSSGTSSKQLKNEKDAQMVAYGSMLLEGFLAVLVILACVAGVSLGSKNATGIWISGEAAYFERYASFGGASGLGAKIGAFIDGSANFIKSLGLPSKFVYSLMGVFVASFAATTLDTACRLHRYVIQELAASLIGKEIIGKQERGFAAKALSPIANNRYVAGFISILVAALLAAIPLAGQEWSWQNAGKGGMLLWPSFGATNQLLGGLAFLVIVFWLKKRKITMGFALLPAIFMLLLPAWAMLENLFFAKDAWLYAENKNWALIIISFLTLLLEAWLIVEAIVILKKQNKKQ